MRFWSHQTAMAMASHHDDLTDVLSDFITASHILHYHNVLDAYGHISLRNPRNPSTFFMSQSCAPALISSRADLVEYRIADATAVEPDALPGYAERCIHSEILKQYPDVNCVVHSHCAEVLPFCVSPIQLVPTIHMAGFLAAPRSFPRVKHVISGAVPVWDITHAYQSSDMHHDLLVRTPTLGASLSSAFLSHSSHQTSPRMPDHRVVLMRHHGFTTAAANVKEAVYQAIYTRIAAQVQTSAAALVAAEGDMSFKLNEKQAADSAASLRGTIDRPWALWCREVEVSPLYKNELRPV